jgi:hypothetical protein
MSTLYLEPFGSCNGEHLKSAAKGHARPNAMSLLDSSTLILCGQYVTVFRLLLFKNYSSNSVWLELRHLGLKKMGFRGIWSINEIWKKCDPNGNSEDRAAYLELFASNSAKQSGF